MLLEMTDTFPELPCTELTIPLTNSKKLPLKSDYVLTPEDLPSSSPLLIYTATVIPDSYIPDNQEQPMRNSPCQLPIVNLYLRIQIKVFLLVRLVLKMKINTLISDNDSIEPFHVQPQNTKPDTKGKHARTAKK
ncbi:9898_t:CDS:2 [Dentiscutata heterogama]|uniref:9898_t:CDS:1 n=1 Tax=Dentiscutata heterogama TaxID=1316150 RepID=A0ACA9JVN6_9GLOM|nr:9898_t:CDS:2 [Dentiscutata heterogama]